MLQRIVKTFERIEYMQMAFVAKRSEIEAEELKGH